VRTAGAVAASSTVGVRPAVLDDCARVYEWNCAPDVRTVSKDPRPIAYRDHARWYAARIVAGSPMWIVEDDEQAVGVIRIEGERISIALDERARGRGIGRRAISLVAREWARPIVAEIATTNRASQLCFEACGFVAIGAADVFLTYQWSP
jgi:GNAT superfamily N-acetyltransferase